MSILLLTLSLKVGKTIDLFLLFISKKQQHSNKSLKLILNKKKHKESAAFNSGKRPVALLVLSAREFSVGLVLLRRGLRGLVALEVGLELDVLGAEPGGEGPGDLGGCSSLAAALLMSKGAN